MQTDELLGKTVVLDTATPWVYMGTLISEDGPFYVLENADAFDSSETTLGKHEYLMMVAKDGIVVNRNRVWVHKRQVVSLSLLEDIR